MNFKLTHEPVLWLTTLAVVATIVADFFSKSVDLGTAVNSVVVAIGGLVARSAVTPTTNNSNQDNVVDGVEEVSQDPDWSL